MCRRPKCAHEVKHERYRFIARRDDAQVRVFSRKAKDWTDRVPLIVAAMMDYAESSSTKGPG
jgi:ATP-dependent DNA ligase